MIVTVGEARIRPLLYRRVSSLFPIEEEDVSRIDAAFDGVLGRVERYFSRVRNKYYSDGGATRFDPLHGCQWMAFLYLYANEI